MAYKDKEFQRAYLKQWRAENPDKVKSHNKAQDQAPIRKRNRTIIQEAKNLPCTDCGVQYPSYVMDFDHVRGKKEYTISSMATGGSSEELVLTEIAKCDVVCANCHRERTFGKKHTSMA